MRKQDAVGSELLECPSRPVTVHLSAKHRATRGVSFQGWVSPAPSPSHPLGWRWDEEARESPRPHWGAEAGGSRGFPAPRRTSLSSAAQCARLLNPSLSTGQLRKAPAQPANTHAAACPRPAFSAEPTAFRVPRTAPEPAACAQGLTVLIPLSTPSSHLALGPVCVGERSLGACALPRADAPHRDVPALCVQLVEVFPSVEQDPIPGVVSAVTSGLALCRAGADKSRPP